MSVLRLTCSPRGAESESHRLSQFIVDGLARADAARGRDLVEIDANRLPHVDAEYAWALGSPSDPDGDPAGSLHQSDQLIQSLVDADYVVIATPMHNYTVPSALKAWIDHVVRVRSTFSVTREGKVGVLADKPVFVAVASGGLFSGGEARQPDFLTPYLKAALATIGLKRLTFFSVEGTAMGGQALEAARLRTQAEIAAYFADAADALAAVAVQAPRGDSLSGTDRP
ncbi:NAD(P)H-dependent oxidoreductase [Achromobacter sp. SIMBA_011]|uniref:FMN-dependent NADH-azoreductase n=1 Tax=Achromobacter sp. SIMBA_011 TaxID=3085759 RepID=UPI003978A44F